MCENNIGAELAQLRKNAKINQADIASKMGVDQSSVSRLEGDPKPSLDEAQKYLAALNGDPKARELSEYLVSEWKHVAKPAFRHPYRAELWMAETAIAKLQEFITNP